MKLGIALGGGGAKGFAHIGVLKPDLLMSDSTNSGVEDFSISEKKVADEILEIMRKTKQRLIVATFASNVHRVSQIIEAAVKCKRKVIVFGRSMENVVDIGRKMGTIHIKNSDIEIADHVMDNAASYHTCTDL